VGATVGSAGLGSTRVASALDSARHVASSELSLGEQTIVRRTDEPQIVERVGPSPRPSRLMMNLQKGLCPAGATVITNEAAPRAISRQKPSS
jgi:hypothetical protein